MLNLYEYKRGGVMSSDLNNKNTTQPSSPLDIKTVALYEKYIKNCRVLDPLIKEIEELKETKYKKDECIARINFAFWLGWLVGIISSIILKIFGFTDVSLLVNVGAVAFLVPSLINKITEFPKHKKYVQLKKDLREKINSIEDENKLIAETLLEMKHYKSVNKTEEIQQSIINKKTTSPINTVSEYIKHNQLKKNKSTLKNADLVTSNTKQNIDLKDTEYEK